MNSIGSIGTIMIAVAALLGAPCHAQPAGQPSGTTTQKQAASTLPAGTAQKSQNNWRGRTLIGTAVFNDSAQRIGTINDLLITDDGRVDQVVLSIRGLRGKLVIVPFSQLRFTPTSGVPPFVIPDTVPTPAQLSGVQTYGAVLSGATRESLAKMDTFRFAQ